MAMLLIATVACLACCSTESADKGRTMAAQFKQAWATDSTNIAEAARATKAALDSCDNADAFATAFTESADNTGDPILMAAAHATVLSGEEAARKEASLITEALLTGSNGRETYQRLQAIYKGLGKVGRADLVTATNAALQAAVDDMPLDKQMQVYAAATTPSLLGAALCRERLKPGADTAAISRQAEALRNIYDDKQYRQFSINYNINSHTH